MDLSDAVSLRFNVVCIFFRNFIKIVILFNLNIKLFNLIFQLQAFGTLQFHKQKLQHLEVDKQTMELIPGKLFYSLQLTAATQAQEF